MTKLYLTSAAADAEVTAGSGNKDKAGYVPGSSARHLNKNSVAGPTAPLQATDGAAGVDGTAVSWYTPPLWGVLIAGALTARLWDRENAIADNVAPTIRVEECAADGSVQSTIVAETTSHGAAEMATTAGGASDTVSVSAANVIDTTISDGERLRITLWIDDAAGQGGTGNMAAGGRGEFWDNAAFNVQGQSELDLADLICPKAGPHLIAIGENGWSGATTPRTIVFAGATNGDKILVLAGGDGGADANNEVTAATTSTTVGSTSAWSELEEFLPVGGAQGWLHAAVADVTATGSVTVSVARTQEGTGHDWGCFALLIRENGGVGNHAVVTSGSTEQTSLAVFEQSLVAYLAVDWDRATPPTNWSPNGAHLVELAQTTTDVTIHAGVWVGQPAGTRGYGTNDTSASTNIRQVAVEILAPAVAAVEKTPQFNSQYGSYW